MLDHIILTVSDIKRSLAFYATPKPLDIILFILPRTRTSPPDLWDSAMARRPSSG